MVNMKQEGFAAYECHRQLLELGKHLSTYDYS